MQNQQENIVNFPNPDSEINRSKVARWKHEELFVKGYLIVPSLFLLSYAHLKPHPLTAGEALFILHLMEHKWDQRAPYPSYKTIAKRMGVSDKMVRRHAQNLEAKHYLRRLPRVGETNQFDLTPLFDALRNACIYDERVITFKAS
jgi:hypothetical protein